ncbi:hypothetical protein SBA3_2220028 [Candidatus Sulfopaludibacter sp. SbA3]|nr:hypothetical protein SBA3_2220028 [Candidatus Sulfopaludibacter sp. SbA3]
MQFSVLQSVGSRERSLFMAEQFALHQRVRNSRAVDHHKRLALAIAVGMDRASCEFLARARFARDQNVGIRRGETQDCAFDVAHDRALADHSVQANRAVQARRGASHAARPPQRTLHRVHQHFRLNRRQQIGRRACAERFNRRIHCIVGRRKNNRHPRQMKVQALNQPRRVFAAGTRNSKNDLLWSGEAGDIFQTRGGQDAETRPEQRLSPQRPYRFASLYTQHNPTGHARLSCRGRLRGEPGGIYPLRFCVQSHPRSLRSAREFELRATCPSITGSPIIHILVIRTIVSFHPRWHTFIQRPGL